MLIMWIFVSTTFRPVSTRTVQGPAQSTIAFSHGSLLFALCCKVLVLEARSVLGLAYDLVTLTFVTSLYEFFDLAAHSSPAKYCCNWADSSSYSRMLQIFMVPVDYVQLKACRY
jgi:hypothetical protein